MSWWITCGVDVDVHTLWYLSNLYMLCIMSTLIPRNLGCLFKYILHISCLCFYWFKNFKIYLCMSNIYAMGLTRIGRCNCPWVVVSELERKMLLLWNVCYLSNYVMEMHIYWQKHDVWMYDQGNNTGVGGHL